ncbi:MAG TPA: FAD-binding oxidoreductase [Rhodobacteraceae bacterium]|nr:FAD-binding oxidoreductase [Paracoccaceae bacterium]
MRWKETEYSGWGRVTSAHGELARPEKLGALKATLEEGLVPAIGMRRSYGDAALNSGGRAIDMTRLDRILAFDADTGVVEAEAGIRIGELARIFAPRGWIPTIMPGTGLATLGGCIAQDVHGKAHHVDGSFGQHVLSVTLLQKDRRVVATPARNKALFRATMGGVGQTGVIVSARIQMTRCPGTTMRVHEKRAENWDAHIALLDACSAPYVVGWVDTTARGADMGRGIVEEGEFDTGREPWPEKSRRVPLDAPSFTLSAPVVKLFNIVYYGRVPAEGRISVRPIPEFFFPLDRILDWNRLYGKRGFYQFQAVVPLAEVGALKAMMRKISDAAMASPLAVLKRMGPGRAGHMSFPMEGYTLALDIPARKGAAELIGALNAMTLEAGGRLYLAKDALADGATIKAMYPEHGEWAAICDKADPERSLQTDLTRRLNLRSGS